MKKLFGYMGEIASGKAYCMMKEVERLKTTGNSVYLTSFADPLKTILREAFYFTKEGKLGHIQNISPIYIKGQIVDRLANYIVPLKYDEFKDLKKSELKSIIARNYEKHESVFVKNVNICNNCLSPHSYDLAFRVLAQLMGTELGRNVAASIWVDIALLNVTRVFEKNLADYAFIDDVRFWNEFEAIKAYNSKEYTSELIGVTASDDVRAKRRKITVGELRSQGTHASEIDIAAMIASLPEKNVIINN